MLEGIGTVILAIIAIWLIAWKKSEEDRFRDVMHQTDVNLGVVAPTVSGNIFTVNRVIDGDTIIIDDGKNSRVRFANIDAYESNSPIHNEIMSFLVPLIQGKSVRIQFTGGDKYDRKVGIVYTMDGLNVNKELVARGYARVYDAYCDKNSDEYIALKRAENAARINRLGGWWLLLNAPWDDRKK